MPAVPCYVSQTETGSIALTCRIETASHLLVVVIATARAQIVQHGENCIHVVWVPAESRMVTRNRHSVLNVKSQHHFLDCLFLLSDPLVRRSLPRHAGQAESAASAGGTTASRRAGRLR